LLNPQASAVSVTEEWPANRFADAYERFGKDALEELKTDKRRVVTVPSAADLQTARAVFAGVRDAWNTESPENRRLTSLVDAALENIRHAGPHAAGGDNGN
jgi:hypothetical protein